MRVVQHVKEAVEPFGHVDVLTLGPVQAAKALLLSGKVVGRLGAGCLRHCWSPPVIQKQSMLLSPTRENLAPQAWVIKSVALCGEFLFLHRQNSKRESGL